MTEPRELTEPHELTEAASVLEPTNEAVPTTAVEVLPSVAANAPAGTPKRRRLRWAIAAVATAFVVAASAMGFSVLASARSASAVLPWAPADALVYAEVRADMPGDQRANLLAFLSKFPGFADQTNFDAKADDGLDKLVKRLTNGKDDFSTDIKPWFGGQLGFSVEGTDPTAPGVLMVASVSDQTKAAAWLKSVTPATWTHEIEGVDLVESPAVAGEPRFAFVLDGSVILAGSVASVKTAVANGPNNALADNASFKAASAALDGDDLGSLYVNLKAYLGLAASAATNMHMPAMSTLDTALLPGWVAMRIRAESDHLVLDEVAPTVAGQAPGQDHVGTLASSLPATTVGEYEIHDLGSFIEAKLTQLESQPGGISAAEVDKFAKYVGGVDKAVGWLGDAGLVVLPDDSSSGFSAGLVAQSTDLTASGDLLAELKNIVGLGLSSAVKITSETYDGQAISLFTTSTSGTDEVPAGTFTIAIAQTDKLVIVGLGDSFVKAVLDTKAGSSLADQPAYQQAIKLAGNSNVAQSYVDLATLRTALEALAKGSSKIAAYDSDVKPFLEPIQSVAWSTSIGSDQSSSRFVLVLK